MDKFITRTKRTDIRTDLPKELGTLQKSGAPRSPPPTVRCPGCFLNAAACGAGTQPWKSPKTPGASKRKTPEGPTKPTSAYSAYSAEHREAYKKANPDKETGDVNKALKAQWKELADDKKQPYLDKEAEETKKYNEELKAAGMETLDEKKARLDAEKAAKKAEKDAEKEKKKAADKEKKVRDPRPSHSSLSLISPSAP